jgi:uncharacterized membrane protein
MERQEQLIGGIILGVGIMYLLDPDRGARRRSLLRDQLVHAGSKLGEGLSATARDTRNRAVGTAAELRSRFQDDQADNEVTGPARGQKPDLLQENWAPATRLVAGSVGTLMVLQGLRSKGMARSALTAAGVGILARAATNLSSSRLVGAGAGRRAIDIQKTIRVAAQIEAVWDLWNNFEQFPRFMSHLREVRRHSDDVSHWVAKGPAGVPVEWDAIVTERVPHEVIAWESVPGSVVQSAGRVRFQPTADGGTEIDIKMSYNPPGGALGHAVAALFGTDPKHAMDEDMVRFKSLLEEGKTTAEGKAVQLDEVIDSASAASTGRPISGR